MQNTSVSPNYYNILQEKYALSEDKIAQLIRYAELLSQVPYNVTAIHDVSEVINYHFADSLELGKAINLTTQTIIDVGSGGGFPGIPIKIAYPNCTVILIEVIRKKREFLEHVIDSLQLENICIVEQDWRTFLRKNHESADIVCSRASLSLNELFRMFQPSSSYKNAQLVYWASEKWEPSSKERALLRKEHTYTVGNRNRKLIFFALS